MFPAQVLADLQRNGLCSKEACLMTSLFVSFVAKTKEIGPRGNERLRKTSLQWI
jgi:hypothetical protein